MSDKQLRTYCLCSDHVPLPLSDRLAWSSSWSNSLTTDAVTENLNHFWLMKIIIMRPTASPLCYAWEKACADDILYFACSAIMIIWIHSCILGARIYRILWKISRFPLWPPSSCAGLFTSRINPHPYTTKTAYRPPFPVCIMSTAEKGGAYFREGSILYYYNVVQHTAYTFIAQ